jgi:hypothetical protein
MSDQDYYRIGSLYSILKLIDRDLRDRIVSEYLHKPKAYVEIIDTDSSVTTLATCSNFNISLNKDNITDRFSCTVQRAIIWNPRTDAYVGLLTPDKRKRINIYFGQDFTSGIKYGQIFTGIISENPENYAFGQDDNIRLKGFGLGHLLEKYEGTYEQTEFTGTGKELIEYYLDQLGVNYVLAYEDPILFTEEEIIYDTMLSGFNTLVAALGPKIETFFTPTGTLVMRDKPDGIQSDVEFTYSGSNIHKLKRFTESVKVKTVANVVGIDDDSSTSEEASASMINTYGRNVQTVSSGLIATSDQAEKIVKDILEEGGKYQNEYEIEVALNPYIWSNSLININESSVSRITDTLVKAHTVTHSYRAGQQQLTRIKGYDG